MTTAADLPWQEHPRPDLQRDAWVNLNGPWNFEFDPEDVGLDQQWYQPGSHHFSHEIVVPFPWESQLSGLAAKEYAGVAWYRRVVKVPDGEAWEGRDVWLIVGACDFLSDVWIDGRHAGEFVGGYVPFEVNLSRFSEHGSEIEIVIRVEDRNDPEQPTGKQVGWYTHVSGIWQTVYLEPRPTTHIEGFKAFADVLEKTITYEVHLTDRQFSRVGLNSPDDAFEPVWIEAPAESQVVLLTAKLEDATFWTPETPVLYDAEIICETAAQQPADRVKTYFGLRSIATCHRPDRAQRVICLNGEPIYLRGALHQAFHPEGIYQYPDDETLRKDYLLAKEAGLNFLRIHIKAPIPRALYWADQLGVLIMEDVPNFWSYSEQSQQWWEDTLEEMVSRDFNHPSVIAWCDFNETWGLREGTDESFTPERRRWVSDMYHLTHELDPTRLVEDNSPCFYDHVVTDINSWHFYINDYEQARAHIRHVVDQTYPRSTFNYADGYQQADAPLINSEYGGIGARSGDADISYCLKFLTNELRQHEKIQGYIYTELTDIEWEHNGLVEYDRQRKEFGYDAWHPGFELADIFNDDFIAIDAPPCIELYPGEHRVVPIAVSHLSAYEAAALQLAWRVDWIDRFGVRREGTWQYQQASWQRYAVVDQPELTVHTGDQAGPAVGVLMVELRDGPDVLARHFVNLIIAGQSPSREVVDDQAIVLRFDPSEYVKSEWTRAMSPVRSGIAAEKVSGQGSGMFEYELTLPADVDLSNVTSLVFVSELAANAGDAKLSWPAKKQPTDYPQTSQHKWPGTVSISLNDVQVHRQTLPDDPADIRGILSHYRKHHAGSYGYLVRVNVEGRQLAEVIRAMDHDQVIRVKLEVPEDAAGGLSVFSDQLGQFPVSPTVVLHMDRP